jgi:hypothetical protein
VEVSFGDNTPSAEIDGLASVAGRWIDYEVPTSGFAGTTGTLIFRLVSRGLNDAVVRLDSLAFATSDDPDGDGLATAQENALGTDPTAFDSDADGFGDGQEISVMQTNPTRFDSDGDGRDDSAEMAAGTDPGDARSAMTVLAFSRAGSGVALRWTSVRGKSYRVLRSSGPGFAAYDVLASGLVAAGMQMEYTDPAVLTVLVPAMFYRAEVEDAPPLPELDSDGDGVSDAQEIAAGSHPGRYDTDRDGIGDGEEMRLLFTSPVKTDTDGDGSSDWAELIAGTNPVNPASVLAITGIVRNADGSVTLRWSGVSGRTYRVLRSATRGLESFEVIANGWPGNPPVTTFIDATIGPTAATAFYRVVVE